MIVIPLLFALFVIRGTEQGAKLTATFGTVFALAVGCVAAMQFDWNAGAGVYQFQESISWLPSLGLELSVGVDSVAMLLVLLTLVLGPICMLCSFTAIKDKQRTYYAWLLVLQAAMTGVFCARDLVFFYICFEFTLAPMWVLISLYGSTNRAKAATKFFLYTFTGSMIALAGLMYVAYVNTLQGPASYEGAGEWTFAISALQQAGQSMTGGEQAWVMAAMLLGFAVKVPLFPVHTWLPLAHTEAPTAGSVILAGVLLKLGTYGIYRFVLPFTPAAVFEYAPMLAVLAIVGIVYAGLICWVQKDVKKLVAYSSVAHLGFCVLGLVSMNSAGLSGSVLYMINHGLSTGALFLLIGMMYERYHTREMRELGGLAKKMPVWATFMVFFVMASVGLPGLNGFVSEFLCLMGAFQAGPIWGAAHGIEPGQTPGHLGPTVAAIAGVGMIVAAMYLLYMVGKVVFGPLVEPAGHHDHEILPTDLNAREIVCLLPLAVGCLVLGLYPTPVLRAIEPSVNETAGLLAEAGGIPRETAVTSVDDAWQRDLINTEEGVR